MPKHFVMFIHGVNTREPREKPTYADSLIRLIKQDAGTADCEYVPLYWGGVDRPAEADLQSRLESSEIWHSLFMKDFRTNQVLQFVGDAALYISRDIGSAVVNVLTTQAAEAFKKVSKTERNYLHLVTHSWGTVILFDVLFASRWNDKSIPGYDDVEAIRDSLFGLGAHPDSGLYLASITTMGSPIAIFSLMSEQSCPSAGPCTSTHDVTPDLSKLLKALKTKMADESFRLTWNNQIHPGDLVAWPLETLINTIVPDFDQLVRVSDDLVDDAGPLKIFEVFEPTALWRAGDAHASYWSSRKVAKSIVERVQATEALK